MTKQDSKNYLYKIKNLTKKITYIWIKISILQATVSFKRKKKIVVQRWEGEKKKQNKEVAADWLHFILFNETG